MSALPVLDPTPRLRRPRRTPTARRGSRPRNSRALSLVPASTATGVAARRAPFVAAVLLLVGAGLVALLSLNTAIAADSFTRQTLSEQVAALQLREQDLGQQVAAAEAPAALAAAARDLGMIPAGAPGFLVVHPDGTTEVIGAATPAARPAPPAPPAGQRRPVPPPADPPSPAGGETAPEGTR